MSEDPTTARVIIYGFMLTWSLLFMALHIQDLFTGEGFYWPIIWASVMGGFAAYWAAALYEEVY